MNSNVHSPLASHLFCTCLSVSDEAADAVEKGERDRCMKEIDISNNYTYQWIKYGEEMIRTRNKYINELDT